MIAVYKSTSSHLSADDIPELHVFAESIGVSKSCFRDIKGFPHYDISNIYADRAIQRGATDMTLREFLKFVRSHHK